MSTARRKIFEARCDPAVPYIWEVWDVEHPALCNHFPVIRVDGNGACDDWHEEIARICADALNARWPEDEGAR